MTNLELREAIEQLKEQLAAIEHERWADWQKWVHDVYNRGDLVDFMPRWEAQIRTPYDKLTDREKASDMEQVDRYWPLIEALLERATVEAVEQAKKQWFRNIDKATIEHVAATLTAGTPGQEEA